MPSNGRLKKMVRYRMAETGEKYTTALRAVEDDPAERERLGGILDSLALRRRYPFTNRDGLDGRHVLSSFEAQRRRH